MQQLIKWKLTPLRIIIVYMVVGGLWMLLSEEILIALISDPTTFARLEILIDWLYVATTAWMLYGLIRRNIAATQEATEALQESEEQFRQLAEHVQEAFWVYSFDQNRFTYISLAYEKIWGYPPTRLYTKPDAWLEAVHPDDRERIAVALGDRRQGKYDETYRIVHPDGTIRWIQDRSFPIQSESGQAHRVCGITRDVTERVLAQERLEQRVEERTHEIERRRKVAEGLRDILRELNSNHPLDEVLDFITTQSSQLLDASSVAICRLRAQESGKLPTIRAACGLLEKYVSTKGLPLGQEAFDQAVAERRPVTISGIGAVAAATGQPLASPIDQCRSVLAVPLLVKEEVYGGLVLYYSTPRQLSDEEIGLAVTLADHAALAIENARLRTQVRQTAVTTERNRLARDLHDSVAQALYSMTLYAEATNRAMAAGKHDVVAKNMRELHDMAREAMLDMRLLIFELHPPVLEDEGLVAALQARIAAVETRGGVQAEVCTDGERRLPLPIEEALYWITQEALNNAVKHAKARHISVHLHFEEEKVYLEVRDDGLGFDTADARHAGGLGMRGIRERVQQIDAKLYIYSVPEEGTTIRVEVEL
ncbi:MAG: PAS domain-containing protein [Anaerolineae bacterium]